MSPVRRILAALLVAAPLATTALGADPAPPHAAPSWAFFDQYCAECHNSTDWAGSLAFDTLEPGVVANTEVMEKTVRKMRGQLMPPAGHKQPSVSEAREFVRWVEGDLD